MRTQELKDVDWVEMFIALKDKTVHQIPIDKTVRERFLELLKETIETYKARGDDHVYDISEQGSGDNKACYLAKDDPLLEEIKHIFCASLTAEDIQDFEKSIGDAKYYFVRFSNSQNCKYIGLREARILKRTLSKQGRIVRWFNDSLRLEEQPIIQLDRMFDAVLEDDKLLVVNMKAIDRLCKFPNVVKEQAEENCCKLEKSTKASGMNISFQTIYNNIPKKNKTEAAKLVYALLEDKIIEKLDWQKVWDFAEKHKISFKEDEDGLISSADTDAGMNFLYLLNGRFYASDIYSKSKSPDRYVATSRRPAS